MLLHVFQKFLGFFFPDGPDKSFEEGYNWLFRAENPACGNAPASFG